MKPFFYAFMIGYAAMSAAFTLARLLVVILLLLALRNNPYNYYVALRWCVFLIAAWGVYKSWRLTTDSGFFVIFHLVLLILFNPFLPLSFEKSTWNVIDIVAGLLLLSIFVVDSISINNFLERGRSGSLGVIVGSIWGVGLVLLGGFIMFLSLSKIVNEAALWIDGGEVQGQVTKVTYHLYESENESGDVSYDESFLVDYSFTIDGKSYRGYSTMDVPPIDGEFEIDEVIPKEPTPIMVKYQKGNPSNNRPLNPDNVFSKAFDILIYLVLGIWPIKVGVRNCKAAIDSLRKIAPTT